VLVLAAIGSITKSDTKSDTPTPGNTPSYTACEALDRLHSSGSQSSFEIAAKHMLRGLDTSKYDVARIQILGTCPQYAYLVKK